MNTAAHYTGWAVMILVGGSAVILTLVGAAWLVTESAYKRVTNTRDFWKAYIRYRKETLCFDEVVEERDALAAQVRTLTEENERLRGDVRKAIHDEEGLPTRLSLAVAISAILNRPALASVQQPPAEETGLSLLPEARKALEEGTDATVRFLTGKPPAEEMCGCGHAHARDSACLRCSCFSWSYPPAEWQTTTKEET